MRPGFTPEMRAALRRSRIVLAGFASFDLTYTVARFWTGLGIAEFLGSKWKGMGQLAGMSEVEENTELRATGMEFSLSGIPVETESGRSLVDYVENHTKGGGDVDAWLALYDTDTGARLRDPKKIFSGSVDSPVIRISGDEFSITLGAEGPLANMQGTPGQRLNDETQHGLFPGDRGLEFVAPVQKKPDELT